MESHNAYTALNSSPVGQSEKTDENSLIGLIDSAAAFGNTSTSYMDLAENARIKMVGLSAGYH